MINGILYKRYREQARILVHERLEHFNTHYQFTYGRVSIRNQKTRWGSCSNKGNLNFSYRLLFLEPDARDYVIIHELCHLKEFNHSRAFWDLVAEQCPDWQRFHKDLKNKGSFRVLYEGWRRTLISQ